MCQASSYFSISLFFSTLLFITLCFHFFSMDCFHFFSFSIIESALIICLSARINIWGQNGRYKQPSDKIIVVISFKKQFSFYFLRGMFYYNCSFAFFIIFGNKCIGSCLLSCIIQEHCENAATSILGNLTRPPCTQDQKSYKSQII